MTVTSLRDSCFFYEPTFQTLTIAIPLTYLSLRTLFDGRRKVKPFEKNE